MSESEASEIFSREETFQKIAQIEVKLRSGDTQGHNFRGVGIQGDIEQALGWHGEQGPQVDISQQDRIIALERLKKAAEGSGKKEKLQGVVTWIDNRVEEIKIDETDKLIANNDPRLASLVSELNALNERHKQSIPNLPPKELPSPEQLQAIGRIQQEINSKKVEIYDEVLAATPADIVP